MTYVLAQQRDSDVATAFENYRAYLHGNRTAFPSSAYALATSDWYFDFADRRCPHDSWLESVTIADPSSGSRHELRSSTLIVRLLGAYHDGHIEFVYPEVQAYDLSMINLNQGHGDWRYDEFRLSETGRVIHEIEWATFGDTGRWLIEASDVFHRWIPNAAS
jgi:hypothetical protein